MRFNFDAWKVTSSFDIDLFKPQFNPARPYLLITVYLYYLKQTDLFTI